MKTLNYLEVWDFLQGWQISPGTAKPLESPLLVCKSCTPQPAKRGS